jgi:hypothetical protein
MKAKDHPREHKEEGKEKTDSRWSQVWGGCRTPEFELCNSMCVQWTLCVHGIGVRID